MQQNYQQIHTGIIIAQQTCHDASKNAGWWVDVGSNTNLLDNISSNPNLIATKLCLVHSEVSEALEGVRKGTMDTHLPQRSTVEVELADAIIRILDLAGALNLDLAGAIVAKLDYNANRPDHKLENRAKAGGKSI